MFEKFQTTLRKLLSVENLHIEGLHWRVENNVVTFEDIEMGGKLKVSLDQVLDIQYGGAWWSLVD